MNTLFFWLIELALSISGYVVAGVVFLILLVRNADRLTRIICFIQKPRSYIIPFTDQEADRVIVFLFWLWPLTLLVVIFILFVGGLKYFFTCTVLKHVFVDLPLAIWNKCEKTEPRR